MPICLVMYLLPKPSAFCKYILGEVANAPLSMGAGSNHPADEPTGPNTLMCTPVSSLPSSGMQQVMAFTRPTMCTAVVHRILIPLHELLPDASPGAHTIGTTKDRKQSPPTLSPGHSPKSPASTPSPDKAFFFLFNQISFN